jgi:hypothetical protein
LPRRAGLDALAARPDVGQVEVIGLDEMGVEELVRARCGAPPGASLRQLFDVAQDNPFHVVSLLLQDLQRRDVVAVIDGLAQVSGGTPGVPLSVQAGVRAHLALLDGRARELIQVLAVWGAWNNSRR